MFVSKKQNTDVPAVHNGLLRDERLHRDLSLLLPLGLTPPGVLHQQWLWKCKVQAIDRRIEFSIM